MKGGRNVGSEESNELRGYRHRISNRHGDMPSVLSRIFLLIRRQIAHISVCCSLAVVVGTLS